jgi:NDP-sugar pyrophosphorylase family protein
MVFAAGLGTRLGDIGRDTPKALIQVGDRTMLEHALGRLVAAGADRVVVNVHHHADRITAFLAARDWGAEVLVSREEEAPLETGGGLWHAHELFRRDRTILLHNVDVILDTDLSALASAHESSGALATLAVNARDTSRMLLFDDEGLVGRDDRRHANGRTLARPPRSEPRAWAFAGVHAVAPRLLGLVTERGAFSIVDLYLRLAAGGERIAAWPTTARWIEIGNAERLAAARAALGG